MGGQCQGRDWRAVTHQTLKSPLLVLFLASLSRSRTRSRASLLTRVATGGCANFGSASALYVKRGNGGGAVLRPSTPGTCANLIPKSTRALYVKRYTCVCGLPGDDAGM